MRAPLTLLLALSFLVQSLPLSVRAEEIPVEPVPVVTEPVPVLEIDLVVEPDPVPQEPVPAEVPTPVVVPVIQEPILQLEGDEYGSFTLEDPYFDISASIELPNGCTIEDDSGAVHVFPIATTTEYLAVCALMEAVEAGTVTELEVTKSGPGLMITSINGVPAGTNEYWSIWINDGYGNCGINCQTLAAGDEIAFVRTAFDPVTYAETPKDRLEITVDSLVDAYDNVLVPDTCSVTDSTGIVHTFPADEDALGICALVAAVSEGHISGYALTGSGPGLYMTSVDDIPAGAQEYWALWLNDAYTECGIACLPVAAGDKMSLVRTTFDNVESDRIDLRIIGTVHVETETDDGDTGTGGDEDEADAFDVSAAFSYLADLQKDDGSIENDLVTDWAAVAFSVSGAPSTEKSLIKQYLKEEEVDLDNTSDYIRHAMAMLALNLNPYSAGPEDYITPIVESFDGTQIGEDQYINDDIFALFPLTHAGYSEDDELIQKIAAFLVAEQGSDGSWVGVDMTAAAVQALAPLSSLPGVPAALTKAETYLKGMQQSNGGFGDPFATPWVIQAIEALGDSPASWKVGDNTPLTYLASIQEEEGNVTTASGTESDAAWATAYAIAAAKGATWHELMDDVRKQEPVEDEDDADDADTEDADEGGVLGAADEITSEPLAPAFTYEAPVERSAPKVAQAAPSPLPEEAPSEDEASDEAPTEQTQTASAADAAGGSWLARTIGSLWSGLINFLTNLFS